MQARSTVPFRHGARDLKRFTRFPPGFHGHIATTCGYVPAKVWCSCRAAGGNGRDPRMDGVRPSRAAKRGALLDPLPTGNQRARWSKGPLPRLRVAAPGRRYLSMVAAGAGARLQYEWSWAA